MEATNLLIRDHEAVKKLVEKYDGAGDQAYKTKKYLFDTIKTVFDPVVKALPSEEAKDGIREADEEHHVAKLLIHEISEMKPEDEQYDAKVTVLKENIEHYVKEEEWEMFPRAKKRLSKERLEQPGDEMEERKDSLKGDD